MSVRKCLYVTAAEECLEGEPKIGLDSERRLAAHDPLSFTDMSGNKPRSAPLHADAVLCQTKTSAKISGVPDPSEGELERCSWTIDTRTREKG